MDLPCNEVVKCKKGQLENAKMVDLPRVRESPMKDKKQSKKKERDKSRVSRTSDSRK